MEEVKIRPICPADNPKIATFIRGVLGDWMSPKLERRWPMITWTRYTNTTGCRGQLIMWYAGAITCSGEGGSPPWPGMRLEFANCKKCISQKPFVEEA